MLDEPDTASGQPVGVLDDEPVDARFTALTNALRNPTRRSENPEATSIRLPPSTSRLQLDHHVH
jgi:hypothetical protein